MIKMVLGTDMAHHFKTIGVLKNRISSGTTTTTTTTHSIIYTLFS